jgi:Xaa-Pro aminopeptidase
MACGRIAAARADRQGVLHDEGEPLTSERMRSILARFLLDRGFTMAHGAIIATAPQAGDCHHSGSGPLHTGRPVIVDIFPRDERTRYWGDCTRTVVHGVATDAVVRMHAAVVAAKRAAIERLRVGVTAAAVHQAATEVLSAHGFTSSRGTISDPPTIQHGTGHGIGLELHEPILLDDGGGEILDGEVFTVEPGLYGRRTGGVRIEDMVAVTAAGPRNFNRLHEGLDWTS